MPDKDSIRKLALCYTLLTVAACTPLQDETSILQNNENALAERVSYMNRIISIDTNDIGSRASFLSGSDELTLTLVAETTPPSFRGITLQANEVVVRGHLAYVGYNVKGETFLGSVDIFDISDPSRPILVSGIIFTDTDINGIGVYGDKLYLAGASESIDYSTPAILRIIDLEGGKLTNRIRNLDLPSYAATDVDIFGDLIYASSGAEGGAISVYKRNDLTLYQTIEIDDARGVDADSGNIAVVKGTNAGLTVFEPDTGLAKAEFSYNGATIPNSKSTIEIKQGKAILGLGDGGTQIVCLSDGSVIASLPQIEQTGLDSSLSVTNAATAYRRGIFIASGEAGVYVALSDSNFNANACLVNNLHLIGKLVFDDLQSVNHVTYRADLLFIATGLGGLKIVTVSINNSSPDGDDTIDNGP